ncbi:GDSL-type esterase/lipase family protein [Engelhardtia mirabilis]|uniref:GDSL-like Lipase/Acylhydrolase n=1 Tax=Engelhardtia mirabilis TaxID=2528011 RepID=A0A518BGW6_9BACT|nr:GDSL-like Lipase/Acylhydrolase [Planctomycetes bacterium Pla133]QDV00490.1 GDSL-like Lipase/Acylhydrolase [Planctomycetes bacterium Pla86]
MPAFLRIALVAALMAAACRPSHRTLPAPAQEAPTPWAQEIEAFERQDLERPFDKGGVVFVGSSSIRLWSSLQEDMDPVPVLNRGFGGSRLADSVRYSDVLVGKHDPSLAVVFSGTNDLAGSDAKSADEVVELFRLLVEALRASDADLPIVYIAITPTLAREQHIETVRDANRRIRAVCDADERLEFIDPTADLADADGRPDARYFRADRLHLNEAGYAIWTDHIRPVVQGLYEREQRSTVQR